MSGSTRFRRVLLAAAFATAGLAALPPVTAAESGWLDVDYRALVDGRQLSHSGEPVDALLRRLAGRPRPRSGERAADAAAHSLLDPLLEPYAFVLSDALDSSLPPAPQRQLVDLGDLYPPGQDEPAWAELLRARRYVVESDGAGFLRAVVPVTAPADGAPPADATQAAKQAWEDAWPVLRHVLAAERRRLARGSATLPALTVEVHAYVARPEVTAFWLGARGTTLTIDDTRPRGDRPPLDLDALGRALTGRVTLQGARLGTDGTLVYLTSEAATPARILGRPLALADAAVAYRAIFHGDGAEPYMSLDRAWAPQTSLVNYGGRLGNTSLGLVSLLCDIRFKTVSQGLDIRAGDDARARARKAAPQFMTHLERFARDVRTQNLAGQQTRLWFYPDNVDLTLSPDGDVLVLRRVRMSAASERVGTGEAADTAMQDPPWTRATIDEVNRDYDALAQVFPELADLDQVVRLLSLFTWLREVRDQGGTIPDLDALLAVTLPAEPTPRTYPQLLTFGALPPAGGPGPVDTLERGAVGEALDRLLPLSGAALAPARRFRRALAALDRRFPEHDKLAQELAAIKPDAVDAATLDAAAYRAERLTMHHLVLSTLGDTDKARLKARGDSGEQIRVFSLGIGGLDLGMGPVVKRAAQRQRHLGWAGTIAMHADAGTDAAAPPGDAQKPAAERPAPREEWRRDPAGLVQPSLAPHAARPIDALAAPLVWNAYDRAPRARVLTLTTAAVAATSSPGSPTSLRVRRLDQGRMYDYTLRPVEGRLSATPATMAAPPPPAVATVAPPAGLALLTLGSGDAATETPTVQLTWEQATGAPLSGAVPRAALQRLVMGSDVDGTPGKPIPGLSPLPPALSGVQHVMVLTDPSATLPPWVAPPPLRPGEEEPARFALGWNRWVLADAGAAQLPRAVVGTDRARSPERWARAPLITQAGAAAFVLPKDAFPGASGALRAELAGLWGASVRQDIPPKPPPIVVLVSAEAPAVLGARLHDWAKSDAMKGKLLLVWPLAAPLRADLPRRLLEDGGLAGLGVYETPPTALLRRAVALLPLAQMSAAPAGTERRAESLAREVVWYF